MAGRGGEPPEDNPFSFKAFVNDKGKKATVEKDIFSDDDEEEDIFKVKATTIAPTPTNSTSADSDSSFGLDEDNVQKDKQKENPFSFKKFLSGSASSSNSLNRNRLTTPNSYAPPDIASDIPTFTNNHFDAAELSAVPKTSHDIVTNAKAKSKDSKKKKDNSLLFGSHDDRADNVLVTSNSKPPLQFPLFDDDNDDDNDDVLGDVHRHTKEQRDEASPGILQLPDFLSDGPLLSNKHALPGHLDDREKIDDDLLGQIRILQEENSRLHQDVARMKQKCEDKNQRITQLKNDMERQKKKEAEETAVMEKAVLQVEENLVTTTQRAVIAESTVTKLNQEVKQLQNQVRSLIAENEAYLSGDAGLSDIKERTKYASEQLKIASDVAEKNLKDLLLGVDKMKLLSQVLATWDKVTEVKAESANDETKTTS